MSEAVDVVANFGIWSREQGFGAALAEVKIEPLGAPHQPRPLPKGWQGIYCFRYRTTWLKVGKAGPKSGARWVSHHYNPGRALSTLAWSLLRYGHLGTCEDSRLPGLKVRLQRVGPDQMADWMKSNTERTNILIKAEMGSGGLAGLEAIGHRLLEPVFEGRWKSGGSSG